MKKIALLLSIITLLANVSFAQEDKTVTLTVSGQGKTQNEAKQNALRNAIEQAFGTFISSNTEILNDDLVKDEIVSISNGNIQKFELLSEVQIEYGEWSTTLKATVSVTNLTSFCESKGISVEFKGSLFAFNINQQILNEKNEIKAIENVCQVIRNIADVSFDYSITASDPVSLDARNSKWRIPIYVSVYKNSNFERIPNILYSTLKGLSLSLEEAENYKKLGKNVYPISIASNENDYSYILLRTDSSISHLLEMLYYFNHSLQNFKISNGITEWSIKDKPENLKYIYDYGIRLFMKNFYIHYWKASVFYTDRDSGRDKDLKYHMDRSNSILDYKKWRDTEHINIEDFQTILPLEGYDRGFTNQFLFVKKLKNEFLNYAPGLIISFIPHYYDEKLIQKEAFVKSFKLGSISFKNKGTLIVYSEDEIIKNFISIAEDSNMSLDNWLSGKNYNLNSKDKDVLIGAYGSFVFKYNYRKSIIMEGKEIVRFYFDDIRTLEEINKISGYRVLPIKK